MSQPQRKCTVNSYNPPSFNDRPRQTNRFNPYPPIFKPTAQIEADAKSFWDDLSPEELERGKLDWLVATDRLRLDSGLRSKLDDPTLKWPSRLARAWLHDDKSLILPALPENPTKEQRIHFIHETDNLHAFYAGLSDPDKKAFNLALGWRARWNDDSGYWTSEMPTFVKGISFGDCDEALAHFDCDGPVCCTPNWPNRYRTSNLRFLYFNDDPRNKHTRFPNYRGGNYENFRCLFDPENYGKVATGMYFHEDDIELMRDNCIGGTLPCIKQRYQKLHSGPFVWYKDADKVGFFAVIDVSLLDSGKVCNLADITLGAFLVCSLCIHRFDLAQPVKEPYLIFNDNHDAELRCLKRSFD